MADILLIFSPDKLSSARQLADALGAEGYSSRLEEAADPGTDGVVAKAQASAAALLVWSRPLASSAVLDGWLASLRQLPNVVEVSTDGIAPQSPDDSRVVLLSGWRGQPFHQGWRRILGELERIGATRSPGKAGARPPASTGAVRSAPEQRRRRRIAIPLGLAAALAAIVVAGSWIGTHAPDSSSGAAAAPRTVVRAEPEAPAPLETPVAEPVATSVAVVPRSVAAEPAAVPAPVRLAVASPTPRPRRTTAESRSAAPVPVKRYSKRYSKTMRRFCARSGRSTPQCRVFLRSMAAAGG